MSVAENLNKLKEEIGEEVCLVAVSKTKPNELIQEAYDAGHRDFGENKAQEMQAKAQSLPTDIQWHFIGHLQRNKVKYIIPHVHLIHSVDSLRLLQEIDKRAANANRTIDVLLQMYIAKEESKFGLDEEELMEILEGEYLKAMKNVRVIGLMGMATNTKDQNIVKREFDSLNTLFNRLKSEYSFTTISMGMSNDYPMAIDSGPNMVRVGSLIFGERS